MGSVEISLETPGAPRISLGSPLTPGAVPQIVTLNMASPSLAPTPGLVPVPAALTPVALAPAAALVPALPQSEISPSPTLRKLSVMRPAASAPEQPLDLDHATVGEMLEKTRSRFGESGSHPGLPLDLDATNRLFSDSTKPGFKTAQSLRLNEPFEFGASEVFRYRTALDAYGAKDGGEATATLLSAAEGLAASAGIKTERGERTLPDGTMRPVLKIVPQLKGHRLNQLAWDLARGFGTGVEYSPERTRSGTAAFNGVDNVLFLPDFGNEKSFEAILHESRHAAFAKRLRNGDISAFHGSLVAYAGRDIAPGAMSYDHYMSLEELSTHAKTLLHTIIRAQRGGGAEAASQARTYAFQLIDVLRSAEINLFQLQRMLDKGDVTGNRVVASPTFRDFKGGHWEMINLPHAMIVLPVLDEAPAPKRGLLDRMFKPAPESTGAKAARHHVEALRPMIRATGEELEIFLGALRGEEPDLKKARASAARMTSLAAHADEVFATP